MENINILSLVKTIIEHVMRYVGRCYSFAFVVASLFRISFLNFKCF